MYISCDDFGFILSILSGYDPKEIWTVTRNRKQPETNILNSSDPQKLHF